MSRFMLTILRVILALAAAFLWIGFSVSTTSLHDSDAAGNALSQGFALVLGISVWLLLLPLLAIPWARGEMPLWSALAALVLYPASAITAFATLDLLSHEGNRRPWMEAIPLASAAILLAYAVLVSLPFLRAPIAQGVFGGVTWGSVLLLSLAPWSTIARRSKAQEAAREKAGREAAAAEEKAREQDLREWREKFAALSRGAPLWEWRPFFEHGPVLRQQAIEGIRRLDRRQGDAEEMLAHGLAFPLQELPDLDLQLTPTFCASARTFLRDAVKRISPPVPGRPYDWEKQAVDPYLPAMQWLLDHHCECGPEVVALTAAVRAYPRAADRDQTLAKLEALHPR
jgi:hypothetical protein